MAEEDVSAEEVVVTPPVPPRVWLDGEDVSGEHPVYFDY
jgi:hypothetical protein